MAWLGFRKSLRGVPGKVAWVPKKVVWVPKKMAWVPKTIAWVPKTILLICISDSCGASKKSENFKCLKTDL